LGLNEARAEMILHLPCIEIEGVVCGKVCFRSVTLVVRV
jgi:hypothetical protein